MKNNLPSGWAMAKVSDLSRTLRGVSYKKGDEQRIPTTTNCLILRGGNIQNGKVVSADDNVYVSRELVLDKQLLQQGDVVIVSSTGSVKLIGKAAAVLENTDNISFGAFLSMLRPKPEIDEKLFGYFFQSAFYRNAIRELAAGININNIRNQYLEGLTFPLPPLAEQRRIVAQLDAVMQKLEASQERLDKLPDLLKKFRQAVLAAAVSGKLTEAWRAEQPQGETGADLLDRIRSERRAQWEDKQRAKLSGKQLSLNDSWKSKYEEPAAPDTSELPELPEGWAYTSLLEISSRITDGTHQPPTFVEEGIPFVFVKHIMGGVIDFTNTRFISPTEYEQLNSRCPVEEGDILYSAVGSYGVAVPVETSDPFSFQRHIAHIKPTKSVATNYVAYFLNSVVGLTQAHKVARGVAQKTVTLGELSKFAVPLPGKEEQLEIVRQVKHYFGLADQLEARFEQAAALVEQLPQALLAKAFSGQLVPQDPDDEPASVLLERLHAEPAAPVKGKRGRKAKVAADAPLFE